MDTTTATSPTSKSIKEEDVPKAQNNYWNLNIMTVVLIVAVVGFVLNTLWEVAFIIANDDNTHYKLIVFRAIYSIAFLTCCMYGPLLIGACMKSTVLLLVFLILNVCFIIGRLYFDYYDVALTLERENGLMLPLVFLVLDVIRMAFGIWFEYIVFCGYQYLKHEAEAAYPSKLTGGSSAIPNFMNLTGSNIMPLLPASIAQPTLAIIAPLQQANIVPVQQATIASIGMIAPRSTTNTAQMSTTNTAQLSAANTAPLSTSNTAPLSTANTAPLSTSSANYVTLSPAKFSQPSWASTTPMSSANIVSLSPTNNPQSVGTQGGAGGGYYQKPMY